MQKSLSLWHEIIKSRDPARLEEILASDCVFLSPVVHTPQRGRAVTAMYLSGAMQVLSNNFQYVKEVVCPPHAVLEFTTEVEGIIVNGVDIMTFDDAGQITEFKVMLRPLKAVNIVHAKMQELLAQLAG